MAIKLELQDDQYPFTGFNHTRKVARAIALDESGKVAIHFIHREDMFCDQTYYETPGGGVDEGETFEEALIRECDEELGAVVEVGEFIGEVIDAYNLIGRKNINRFYFAYIKKRKQKHFASSGDQMIKDTLYLDIDEAIKLYEGMPDTLVSGLVKQRELPILREAKRLLTKAR
ncbi:MAG: NUDIX hydrolase [Bacilli bacterium]|nr:NUDIX hydrolase [Bacilli bacterium]